jgi:hypothetical protein
MKDMTKLPKGTKVKVINNTGGSNYVVGGVYTIYSVSGTGTTRVYTLQSETGFIGGTWINYFNLVEVFESREKEGKALLEEGNELLKRAETLIAQGNAKLQYKDDEEELADLISKTFKENGDKKAVYNLLKKSTLLKRS